MKKFTAIGLGLIALTWILLPLASFGGVREQVAVAEAVVYVAQLSQPPLPNDFEDKPRGEAHPIHDGKGTDSREKLASRPLLIVDEAAMSQGPIYEATVYTAAWCGPCHSMRNKLGDGDERLRLTWVESAPPRGVPEAYPTICWTDANGITRYVSGVHTLNKLVDLIDRNNPPTPVASNTHVASGVGGVVQGREMIVTAIGVWRHHIGQAKVTGTWSRNGAQTLPLLKASEWTPQALFGTNGSIRFAAPGSNLPVGEGDLSYRIEGNRIRLKGETSVELSRFIRDEQVVTAEPAGVSPLTILSVIATIYKIINPTMDVTIPGEIEATGQLVGDVLTIRFTKAPSVKIVALFRFNLAVESVEVSAERVRVVFSGSRWIRERVFEVKQ